MNIKFILKISILMIVAVCALMFLDYTIIRGNPFGKKLGVPPVRARYVFEGLANPNKGNQSNLKAVKMSIESGSEDGFFHVGDEIVIACTIYNDSAAIAEKFRTLIRTPREEIASETTWSLAPKSEYKLNGTITPEKSGVLIVACRSDVDKEIDESNEMDNREVKALYILPQ